MNLFRLIAGFFKRRGRREGELVSLALKYKKPEPLIQHLMTTRETFIKWSTRDYVSPSGRITVCDDIYGYEVKIDGGEMLDCSPSSYGLTRETADRLYIAILSCVPNSVAYHEKIKAELV